MRGMDKKIGFIGTGSMGTILIEAFLNAEAFAPEQVLVTNRTSAKAKALADKYPGMRVAGSGKEVAGQCDITFICVKPAEFKHIVDEIRSVVVSSQIIVSITSPVLIRHLEDRLACKIAKIVPSVTNRMRTGASLCIYGQRMTPEDKNILDDLMSKISSPVHISESNTRIASDISSCGPAFLAYFVQKLIEAAVEETGLPEPQATRLACEMVLGTGKLLTAGNLTPRELQQKVAVPGGITAEGLRLLEHELNGAFNKLIRITHAKYEEDLHRIGKQFAAKTADETT